MMHRLQSSVKSSLLFMICISLVLLITGCGGAKLTQAPESASEETTTVVTPPTVEPDESETPSQPGTGFTFSNLVIANNEVKINEKNIISVKVSNNSPEIDSFTVELRINGTVAQHQDITLEGGASTSVNFNYSNPTPGAYTVAIGSLTGSFTILQPPTAPDTGTPVTVPPVIDDDWVIEEGSGTMYRAIHMGGNWGTNTDNVANPPAEYMAYLRDLNVNWVGFSVALHLDGSMDSTVEFAYGNVPIATWSDDVIRNLVRELRRHGFHVYIHVAIESGAQGEHPVERWQLGDPLAHTENAAILPEYWPWRTDHPQHTQFVAEFWRTYTDCLVHIATIAEEEGVEMLTLGTETDRLFRSRSSNRFPNNFLQELLNLSGSVRRVYNGMLGYEQNYSTLIDEGIFGLATGSIHRDLGLDFIGVSSYFPLAASAPQRVLTVGELETAWDSVFRQYLEPLQTRNYGKPIVFTEFGYTDSHAAPFDPIADQFVNKVFRDDDGNGIDDGEEQQANCIQAFYNVCDNYNVNFAGAFLWDVMMSTADEYEGSYGKMRSFNIRGKEAEEIVRQTFAGWID